MKTASSIDVVINNYLHHAHVAITDDCARMENGQSLAVGGR